MKLERRVISALVIYLAVISGIAFAHHGTANFDMNKEVNLKGEVTEFRFINPHSFVVMKVNDDKGNAVVWECETGSANGLYRAGLKRSSFKPGDQITVVGRPAKNGKPFLLIVKATMADGKEFIPER